LHHFAGDKAEVYSAGVETHGVNPGAVETMKEDGIDISNHTCNNIDEYRNIDFDFVITVCDNDYFIITLCYTDSIAKT
jgi:arsenate reductase